MSVRWPRKSINNIGIDEMPAPYRRASKFVLSQYNVAGARSAPHSMRIKFSANACEKLTHAKRYVSNRVV